MARSKANLFLSAILVTSLLITFGLFGATDKPITRQATRALAQVQSTAGIIVDPSTTLVLKGAVFTINVKIINVSNLCGWQFELYWSNSVLNCTTAAIQTPPEWQNNYYNFSHSLNNNFNATHGRLLDAVARLKPAPPFNGSTTVATVNFGALQAGMTSLTLDNDELGDWLAEPIAHTVSHGSSIVYNPVCAMKTLANGYFYIPSVNDTILKIELLFNETLVADQTSGVSPYPNITKWPNGVVDIYDAIFVQGHLGQQEGNANWEYMADVVADKVIDIYDAIKVGNHYGNSGTYDTNLTSLSITFSGGNTFTPDLNGYIQIPQNATSFTVYRNGSQTGALVVFGKG